MNIAEGHLEHWQGATKINPRGRRKREIWPQRPRYFAAAVAVQRGSGGVTSQGQGGGVTCQSGATCQRGGDKSRGGGVTNQTTWRGGVISQKGREI